MISYEKNHNYQHILELLEDGFIRADINGVITMANRIMKSSAPMVAATWINSPKTITASPNREGCRGIFLSRSL